MRTAAFYTILDHLEEKEQKEQPSETEIDSTPMYSFSTGDDVITFESESEFGKAINGREQSEILPVLDELMATLKIMNRRLYNGVLRKLSR